MSEVRPLRVVFDTNVLLSLFVFSGSRFAPLRDEVEAGRWLAYTRPDCLDEFHCVLKYPMFKLEAEAQKAAFAAYTAVAQMPDESPSIQAVLPRCKDKDDQKFIELANEIGADWLVSADKAVLKLARKLADKFEVLKPEQALARLQAVV
jgi:uncharacterized protein